MHTATQNPHELLTIPGFLALFDKMYKESANQKEAYEKTETEYVKMYRRRRYANFESFTRARSYQLNKHKRHKK